MTGSKQRIAHKARQPESLRGRVLWKDGEDTGGANEKEKALYDETHALERSSPGAGYAPTTTSAI